MTIKTGATVRQVQPAPMVGEVIERRFNDSADAMEYHVRNGDGSVDRWFLESEIESTGA